MVELKKARRVGLFGGSFDPVHSAHLALARAALTELPLDEVRWIPAGQPWQKERSLTPAEHREAMVALAIAHEPRFVLDEHGSRLSTTQLAERLRLWRDEGRDAALLIGGPDGLDPALKTTADETLRLSDLTLPHALARVLLAEALYRAWTLGQGHPYHRE